MIRKYNNFLFESSDNIEFIKTILPEAYERLEIKYLNRGTNGVAYSLGDDFVLKITNDPVEARTAAWLSNNNFMHIAHIYTVYQVESRTRFPSSFLFRFPYWEDVYFIVLEKLDTSVSKDISNMLAELVENFPFDSRKKTVLTMLNQSKVKTFFKKSKYYELYKEVKELLSYLKVYGINFYDFHEGNVGRKKNGKLAIFDVFLKNKQSAVRKVKL